MAISRSVLLFFLAIVLVFSGSTTFLMNELIDSGFRALEKREAANNAERVVNFLSERHEQLSSKVHDWAVWDESYKFGLGENPDFPKANIAPANFSALNIDWMAFEGVAPEVVYSMQPASSGGVLEENLPMLHVVKQRMPKFDLQGPSAAFDGLFLIKDQPMLISRRPLMRGDGSGPPAGVVYFGIFVTDSLLQKASLAVKMQVSKDESDAMHAWGNKIARGASGLTLGDSLFSFTLGKNKGLLDTRDAEQQLIFISLPESVSEGGELAVANTQPALQLKVSSRRDIMLLTRVSESQIW